MRRFDPAGAPLLLDSYVFGNEIGERVKSHKRAWNTAVLKAHGYDPTYTKTVNLIATRSRAALATIDLHFHDLRREAGSRWLEGGVPLHTIRDWLGHTSIAQTSAYQAGTMKTQHDAMRQFEERRVALQPFATDVRRGGQRRPQSDPRRERTPNKTRSDMKRLSCKSPLHGGGQWLESTRAHQPWFILTVREPRVTYHASESYAAVASVVALAGVVRADHRTHGGWGRSGASAAGGVAPRPRGLRCPGRERS